jgi:hypothetical protein
MKTTIYKNNIVLNNNKRINITITTIAVIIFFYKKTIGKAVTAIEH